jgi:solute:Na+ symporter, SSS family
MHWIDGLIVAGFMLGLLGIGFVLSRRAGKSTDEFILSGRTMPWWLAGTSIAATGLNASTMLRDSRKIRQDGLSGLWYTWSSVVGNIVMAVFMARLWRRAGFTTQMEFYHARYRGKAADWARLYDSAVYGIIVAATWAAVGLVGMKKIASVLFDLAPRFTFLGMTWSTDVTVVGVLVVVTLIYSAASGVYGVVWTDFFEFIIAVVASFVLMFMVYADTGWNVGLREGLSSLGDEGARLTNLMPTALPVLLYFMIVQPVISMGGYSPQVQRFLCLRNEREALYTAFHNAFLNFVLKPWPYYVCGLCGIFLFSDAFLAENFQMVAGPDGAMIPDYEKVFPLLVERYLPVGLTGLMAAAFLSAFMSSFDTNIHNSTAILINDVYRPYLVKGRSEHHYVRASRIYMVIITVVASWIGIFSHDILKMSMFAISITLAPGVVKLLRFIWWRVNGITEVVTQWVALAVALVSITPRGTEWIRQLVASTGHGGNDAFFITRQFLLVGAGSLVSLGVLCFTAPEPMDHLCSFYRRVRPFGWWGPVREACGEQAGQPDSVLIMLLLSLCSIGALMSAIFTVAGLLLAMWTLFAAALACFPLFVIGTIWGVKSLYPTQSAAAVHAE